MKGLLLAFLSLALAPSTRAQSINVDFGPPTSPHGSPTAYYGGSAASPGYWNSVSSIAVSGLKSWDGAVTGVSLTLPDNNPGCGASSDAFDAHDIPETNGQPDALLDDRYNPAASVGLTFVFQGLQLGDYVVDTIVPPRFCPGSGGGVRIGVVGSPDPPMIVTGGWPGSFAQGVNYARHSVTVNDGTLTVTLDMVSIVDYIEISGIQLDHDDQELPGAPLCFGDGLFVTCPCSNDGRVGHGCQNSVGTGGAFLFATGTTSPDSVVLHTSGELPSALSIFFQGNASITPVFYGDGLRCAGGTVRRLYTKSASGGEALAPEPSDPSITVRSAQVGVPIPVGGRRYYQVFYRDPNPTFCPSPIGSTFNVTDAVRIYW